MSSFLIQIIAKSNLAATLLADEQALQKQNRALAENTVLNTTASVATDKATRSVQKDTVARTANKAAAEKQGIGLSKALRWLLHLDAATNKVGYNIMGFSIRVGGWFMPLMAMMYISMLPVIGALIAMGSAAVVAAGGLVGVLGVGALLMYRRQNKNGSGMYAGARRPYADQSQSGSLDFMMNPVWGALDTAQLNDGTKAGDYAVEKATTFFKTDLPGAITSFLRGVDRRAMDTIMNMFTTWLPGAANGLAQWGSKLFKLIGPGSLARLNGMFKWLAGGIMGMALWLEATDWKYIDQVTSMLGDMGSTLMHVGKESLPVFAAIIDQIWPFPLRPLLLAFGEFFASVGENESALTVLSGITQALVTLMTFRYLAGLSTSLIGIKATLAATLVGAAYAFYTGFGVVVGAIALGGLRLFSGLITFGLGVVNVAGNLVRMVLLGMLDVGAQVLGFEENRWQSWRSIDPLNDDWMSSNFGIGPTAMKGWSGQFDKYASDLLNGKKRDKVELVIQPNDEHIVKVVSDNVSVTSSPVTAATRGIGRPSTNARLG